MSFTPVVRTSVSIPKTLLGFAKERKIDVKTIDFELISFQTLMKREKDLEYRVIEDTKSITKEDYLTPTTILLQEYSVKIFALKKQSHQIRLAVATNKLKTKKEIEDKNYYFIEKYLKANFGYKNNYREESNLIFGTPEVYTISKKYSLCQIKKAIARARKNKEVRKRELIKYFIIDKIGDNAPFNVSSFLGGDAKENLAKLKKARDLAKKYNVSLYKTMELKSIKEIQSTKYGSCIYADAVATVTYREVKDWNYYSKNYKHPKITVYGRKVTFEKKGYIKTVDLDNFNGDFLLKAYVKAFKVKAYKQKGFARKVQLNDYLRTKKIRCIGNVELWERTINKAHYDYCAVINKTTYHAFTKKEALSGLKKKINAKIKKEMEVISKKTGYNLGFCETGMKSFCEDNDLDLEGSYTRAELRNIILQKRKLNCDKYAPEIRKLGIILGC